MTETKTVRVSLLPEAVHREAFGEASRFRGEFYECLIARRDELFELTDAVLSANGAVKTPVDLTLAAGHGISPDRWQEMFEAMMGRIAPRFARVEPRRLAQEFVLGLLSDLPRKNCWTVAEHAGDATPD
jgi:hypothetical protein